jgi:hypothetical protein
MRMAEALSVCRRTVARVRQQFAVEGLDAAVLGAAHPGLATLPKEVRGREEARNAAVVKVD